MAKYSVGVMVNKASLDMVEIQIFIFHVKLIILLMKMKKLLMSQLVLPIVDALAKMVNYFYLVKEEAVNWEEVINWKAMQHIE